VIVGEKNLLFCLLEAKRSLPATEGMEPSPAPCSVKPLFPKAQIACPEVSSCNIPLSVYFANRTISVSAYHAEQ
jgi:hypothetical protein